MRENFDKLAFLLSVSIPKTITRELSGVVT
jgi:hypothetical protein